MAKKNIKKFTAQDTVVWNEIDKGDRTGTLRNFLQIESGGQPLTGEDLQIAQDALAVKINEIIDELYNNVEVRGILAADGDFGKITISKDKTNGVYTIGFIGTDIQKAIDLKQDKIEDYAETIEVETMPLDDYAKKEYVDAQIKGVAAGGSVIKYIDITTGVPKDHIKKLKSHKDNFAKVMLHRNVKNVARLGTNFKAKWNPLSVGINTFALLKNGKVFVGGNSGKATILNEDGTVSKAEWKPLTTAIHTSMVLPDGKIFVAGGGGKATILNEDGTVSKAEFGTKLSNDIGSAVLLQNGKILIIDSSIDPILRTENSNGAILKSDGTPAWESFTIASGWRVHTATLMNNGKVFVAGSKWKALILDEGGGASRPEWSVASPAIGMYTAGDIYASILLQDGRVLVGLSGRLHYPVLAAGKRVASTLMTLGEDGNEVGTETGDILRDHISTISNTNGYIFLGSVNGKSALLDNNFAVQSNNDTLLGSSVGNLKSLALPNGRIFVGGSGGECIIINGAVSDHDHEDVISWNEDNGKVWIINGSSGISEDIGSLTLDDKHTLSIQYMDEVKGVVTDVETTRRKK